MKNKRSWKVILSSAMRFFGISLLLTVIMFPTAQSRNPSAAENVTKGAKNRSSQSAQRTSPRSSAAPKQQQKPPEYSISVESNLVVVDVLVTDEDGRVLTRLKRGNFRILDDGKPQIVTHFAPSSDPITIVMLLEYSALAYDYFAYKGADWGTTFLNHLGKKDWVALVTYDMKPTVQADSAHDRTVIRDALGSLSYPTFHEANLFDALADTLDRLKRTDVTVSCVGVAESEYMMSEDLSYLQAKNQLQAFARLTGGSAWFPRFEGEIPSIFRSVVDFLRSQYSLGFSPLSAARDEKYHKLKVEIVAPDGSPLPVKDEKGRRRKINVYAREGYVASADPGGHSPIAAGRNFRRENISESGIARRIER